MVFFLVCLAGCHTSASRTWKLTSITGDVEALAGARAAPAVEARYGGVVRNANAERRIAHVGQRLTQALPELHGDYQYRLLDSDQRNAVSLPGGRIYITRALYARLDSDELIAATLAHEMAHILAKDHFKPRPHNPDHALRKELSTDKLAAVILNAASLRRSALLDLIVLIEDTLPDDWGQARTANLAHTARDSDNHTIQVAAR